MMQCFVTWQGRDETPAEHARRLTQMLSGLAAIDPAFAAWFRMGNSLEEASQKAWQMPPDVAELTRLFEVGQTRDYDGNLSDYALHAWNGPIADRSAKLRFFEFIGMRPGRPLLSSATCELVFSSPRSGKESLGVDELRRILAVMVEAWDASFGYLGPGNYLGLVVGDTPLTFLSPNWLTYFTEDLSRRIVPPSEVAVLPGPFAGSIFQTTPAATMFDGKIEAHLAAGRAMQQAARTAFGPWSRDARPQDLRAQLGWV